LRYRQTSNTMDHSDSVVFEHSQESGKFVCSRTKLEIKPYDNPDDPMRLEKFINNFSLCIAHL
jgi:hypothetical protein